MMQDEPGRTKVESLSLSGHILRREAKLDGKTGRIRSRRARTDHCVGPNPCNREQLRERRPVQEPQFDGKPSWSERHSGCSWSGADGFEIFITARR
jgi:hypothetical protein